MPYRVGFLHLHCHILYVRAGRSRDLWTCLHITNTEDDKERKLARNIIIVLTRLANFRPRAGGVGVE